jgi:hypothetical protein
MRKRVVKHQVFFFGKQSFAEILKKREMYVILGMNYNFEERTINYDFRTESDR